MKHPVIFLLIVFLISSCHRASQDPWVAAVGDQKIMVRDLKDRLAREKENYSQDLWQDSEGFLALKKQVLQGMVERAILIQEAEHQQIKVPEGLLTTTLQELKEGYGDEEFEKLLNQKNLSEADWKETQSKKLQVDLLLDREIYQKIPISEEDLKSYYQNHRKEFYEPDQAHCQHIVTNKKEKASMILSLLNKGESFATVAQKFSESPDRNEGGDLGLIKRNEFPPVFNVCFDLGGGQTSSIVGDDYGFHIFHLIEKKAGHSLPLAEVRERIKKNLVAQKGQTALKTWIEALFQKTKVSIREDVLREIKSF